MALMVDIVRTPRNSDALIRIRRTEMVINARAAQLLGLNGGSRYVRVTVDREEQLRGRTRIYIAGSPEASPRSYVPHRRHQSYKVYSMDLCRSLAESLEGQGVYRICSEVYKEAGGEMHFEIYNKKYE